MSIGFYDKLKKIVEENSDIVDTGFPASDEKILGAEQFLGLAFPYDYKKFLRTWGSLAIGPNEYYGIAGDSFENSSIPNGIWFTAVKRKQLGLPHHLIVISTNEGDQYLCLDTNCSTVVVWDVPSKMITGTRGGFFEFIIEDAEDFV